MAANGTHSPQGQKLEDMPEKEREHIKEALTYPKAYSFLSAEMEFLGPRQEELDRIKRIAEDTHRVMNSYIQEAVVPRLGLDPKKETLSYDINQQSIMISKKPEESTSDARTKIDERRAEVKAEAAKIKNDVEQEKARQKEQNENPI